MRLSERANVILRIATLVLIVLGIGVAITYSVRSFRVGYRVAYATGDHGGSRLQQVIGQAVNAEKTWIAFRRTQFDSLEEASRALEGGKADIALVRPDVAMPANYALIGVLRKDAV